MDDVIHVCVAAECPMNRAPHVSRVAIVELAERAEVPRLELVEQLVVRTPDDRRLRADARARHEKAPGFVDLRRPSETEAPRAIAMTGPEPTFAPANAGTTAPMTMVLPDIRGPLEAKVFMEIGMRRCDVAFGRRRGFRRANAGRFVMNIPEPSGEKSGTTMDRTLERLLSAVGGVP